MVRRYGSEPARIGRELSRIRSELRAAQSQDKHFDLRNYLGSPVPVLGVYTAELRKVVRGVHSRNPGLSESELLELVGRLWQGDTFDERIAAIELVQRYHRFTGDRVWQTLDEWVDSATGWGLSDSLAGGPVSRLLDEDPRRLSEVRRWASSPNMWRRRASLYAMNRWIRSGRLDPAFALFERLYRDPELWVQRAVGTWLRESWKVDRDRTRTFLLERAVRLPAVTVTVATERAPKSFRSKLRALSRSRLR
jgi:3-methyladenine DNA glycosylase AlkD